MIFAVQINFKNEFKRYRQLLPELTNERRQRVSGYRSINEKIRSVLAERLIRFAVSKYTNSQLENFEITFNPFGKPLIKNVNNVHFNISHAGNWIVCAVNHIPVGIDVEKNQLINFEMAQQFCTEEELQTITGLSSKKKQQLLMLQIWSLKESIVKTTGKGLSMDLKKLSVVHTSNLNEMLEETIVVDDCRWRLQQWQNTDYVLSVASGTTESICKISPDDLYPKTLLRVNYE